MGPGTTASGNDSGEVSIRLMLEDDLDRVDGIFRRAFGTFLGAPEPESFFGDSDMVRTRWRADPGAALVAELGGGVVGSNFATSWGSFGFFGPLTVDPDYWDRGIARALMAATMELFASWATEHVALFTFAHSPRHLRLYQAFGFWPRFLTAVLNSPVFDPPGTGGCTRFSELSGSGRAQALSEAAKLCGTVHEGLDLSREIRAVYDQRLGDTVLVEDGTNLQAFAVCHIGPGSEAGSGTCYVKFAAAAPGPLAARSFDRLLEACNDLAASSGASVVQAGVNLARTQAYGAMVKRGFRVEFLGVAMHRPNEDAFDRPDAYVIDDLR